MYTNRLSLSSAGAIQRFFSGRATAFALGAPSAIPTALSTASNSAARAIVSGGLHTAGWGYGAVRANKKKVIGASVLGGGALLAAGWGSYNVASSFGRGVEADYMSRLLLTAQSGPLGPAGSTIGFNRDNTAGLTLASHYAKNRNKFGLLGLRYL